MADLYAVFNITDPDNPVQISALMTLIEAEVEIQRCWLTHSTVLQSPLRKTAR